MRTDDAAKPPRIALGQEARQECVPTTKSWDHQESQERKAAGKGGFQRRDYLAYSADEVSAFSDVPAPPSEILTQISYHRAQTGDIRLHCAAAFRHEQYAG